MFYSMSHAKKSALGMAILAVVILVIFSGSGDILTRQRTEAYLNRFNDYVMRHSNEQNKEAKLKYGAISMHGWGYDTSAVVSDISYEISEHSLIDSTRFSLSTASMMVEQPHPGIKQVRFLFKDPINVIKSSQMTHTIMPSAPISYTLQDQGSADRMRSVHTVHLPEQVIISSVPAAGEEEIVRERLLLSFGKNNFIKAESDQAANISSVSYQMPDIKIVHDNSSSISVADLTVNSNIRQIDENKINGRFEWRANDIVVHDGSQHSKPHSLIFDADFTGDRVEMDYLRIIPVMGNMDFSVHKIALIGENFNIIAAGNLFFATSDPLPSGNLDIEIVNAEQLLASDLISASLKEPIRSTLKKISGVKGDFAERTPVTIKREKNGVLYVGGITFEELTASVIAEFLKMQIPAAVGSQKENAPAAPSPVQVIPAPAPASAPVQSEPVQGETTAPKDDTITKPN